jgi:nucleoporin NUP82
VLTPVRSISVGQYYHGFKEAPIAKIDWHPWGDGGTTLLVMTVDGKLRYASVLAGAR